MDQGLIGPRAQIVISNAWRGRRRNGGGWFVVLLLVFVAIFSALPCIVCICVYVNEQPILPGPTSMIHTYRHFSLLLSPSVVVSPPLLLQSPLRTMIPRHFFLLA